MFTKVVNLIPKAFVLVTILLMCVQSYVYGLDNYFPAIDLMVIYYWCVYRPSLLGNGYVFAVGFLKDILINAAFGINAFTNLTIRLLIMRKGGNFQPTFYFLWFGFAIILMVAITIKWLLFSFVAQEWLNVGMALKHFFVSVLIYPFVHNFLNKIYVLLPRSLVNA
jgi:rod shape-determining protein MreD